MPPAPQSILSVYRRMTIKAVTILRSGHHLQVLAHVAKRVRELHEKGFVHRDIKPGNIIWLPKKHCWTLIDFGLSSPLGEVASTAGTVLFAAPEVLRAIISDQESIRATPALDAWSVGILAVIMFTGAHPLEGLDVNEVRTSCFIQEDKST